MSYSKHEREDGKNPGKRILLFTKILGAIQSIYTLLFLAPNLRFLVDVDIRKGPTQSRYTECVPTLSAL